jgi:hypothetical protein
VGGETHVNDAGAARVNLPAVVPPKLEAADQSAAGAAAEQSKETKGAAASAPIPAATPARSKRFIALAASVAFAAGFGSFVGSISGSGLARFIYPPAPPLAPTSNIENTVAAMREIKLELAELAALKASLDSAARNTTNQYAKIADRLDRMDQRSAAAIETTASLPAAAQTAAPANAAPVLAAVTPPPESPKLSDHVLPDWVVHDVRNGHALVESRYSGLFAVSAGSVLPGIGRVDTIKRQDGHWVVLTARGAITSAH